MKFYIIIAIALVIIIGIYKNRDNDKYIVNTNTLNVRIAPSIDSSIILQIYKDQKVEIENEYFNKEWQLIKIDGMQGYVSKKYLTEPSNFFFVFISAYTIIFIPMFISLFFGKIRKKDSRYASGFRLVENNTSFGQALSDSFIYSYIISLLFSIFS